MCDIQYVDAGDIRDIVEQDCQFEVEDHGIGYYEYGDGKYNDISLKLSLTSTEIMVQYPIDNESIIYTFLEGTYSRSDEYGDYECEYMATLNKVEYNSSTGMFDATYDVEES